MVHYMHLEKKPFEKILKGTKTVELRLFDEKRSKISVGDIIEFARLPDGDRILVAQVAALHRAASFEELAEAVSFAKCGSNPRGEMAGFMDKYYSPEKQKKYGALGIEIRVLEEIKTLSAQGVDLSVILRHAPHNAGVTLDADGFAPVDKILEHMGIDLARLEEIVKTDDKCRFFLSEDKSKIRANYGHSVPVGVEMEILQPPEYLYHGTAEKYAESIEKEGLLPKSRLFVHLSEDYDTAVKVGSRHGEPIVLRVKAGQMHRDGFEFRRSYNGVWLTEAVPSEYLEK